MKAKAGKVKYHKLATGNKVTAQQIRNYLESGMHAPGKSTRKNLDDVPSHFSKIPKPVIFICVGFLFGIMFTAYFEVDKLFHPRGQLSRDNIQVISTPSVLNKSSTPKPVVKKPYVRPTPLISNNPKAYWVPVPPEKVGLAVREDRHRYVCPNFGDRLGNLMFLYAANYGLAVDHNLTLAMSSRDPIYTPFQNVPRPSRERYALCKGGAEGFRQPYGRIYVNFPVQPQGRNVRFSGYLQCWKYFSHSFDDIRQQFTWRSHIQVKALEIISDLVRSQYPTENNVTTVAIHIRRGDYVTERRPMADKIYVEEAKDYFLKRYHKVLFIIATNPDKEARAWCLNNVINGSGISVFSGNNDRYVDMAILTLTDHVIISTGTYGWWGGFLNNGTVVHYDWIPPGYYKFRREDYILPWWVGINSTTKYPPGPPKRKG